MTIPDNTSAILTHCKPLDLLPTNLRPNLHRLNNIRAVLFDIYGTLLISASGDIGTNSADRQRDAIEQTLEYFQLTLCSSAETARLRLEEEIANSHAASKARGIAYPEVDIVEIWQRVIPRLVGCVKQDLNFQQLALEYEVRVNPVWPMPGLESTLEELAKLPMKKGIVSNAQFFTPILFSTLINKSMSELGFLPEITYLSYEYKQAKPGSFLFSLARQKLEDLGVAPNEVLYVGNDMLNDIAAAGSVGFRTALFAGDRRSLRLRDGDSRVSDVLPDITVTELPQLLECLVT